MRVRLADAMGSDLSIVNAARASFMKESAVFSEADERLIRFLAREGHESPFRHGVVRLNVESTLYARILWETGRDGDPERYRTGMVFRPTLTELLSEGAELGDRISWRWTASVQASMRFVNQFRDQVWDSIARRVAEEVGRRFPVSVRVLSGFEVEGQSPAIRDAVKIPVLDRGYVRLVDWIVGPTDEETVFQFEIYAPMMVRSQWFKYVRGGDHCPAIESGNGDDGDGSDPLFARNEASRRYVTLEPEFYLPWQWRSAPENRKQGSGGPVDRSLNAELSNDLRDIISTGVSKYEEAIRQGVAPEMARLFLPAYGLYTCWRWTASKPAVAHFLEQRLGSDAQTEIREYAKAVKECMDAVGL